jgi:hypothetical protein
LKPGGVIIERLISNSNILCASASASASASALQCIVPNRHVQISGGVIIERLVSQRHILMAARVALYRIGADGHIVIARLIHGWSQKIVQCILADGQIVIACIFSQRIQPNGGVVLARRAIVLQRPVSHRRVVQPALQFGALQAKRSQRGVSAGVAHACSIQLIETN